MITIKWIEQWDSIRLSPAWEFVAEACKELDENGFVEHGYAEPPHSSDAALIAFTEDKEPMGFISYRFDDRWSNWWITMAYTLPKFRMNKVHSEIFKALVKRAEARGDITSIESGTHANNVIAKKAFESQGRELVTLGYSYKIRSVVEGKHYLEIDFKEASGDV